MELIKSTKNKNFQWPKYDSSLMLEVSRGETCFTSSAVAIGENILLSAAHCVEGASEVLCILGDAPSSPEKVLIAKRWVVHHEYNPSKSFYENDLAIIFLEEKLPSYISYESIEETHLSDKSLLERIGFGGRLNKNTRTLVTPSFIGKTFNQKNFLLKDKHSVLGDSGGPIFVESQGELKLVGLHSTLEGEHLTYAINLAHYKGWLENMLSFDSAI